MADLQFGLSKKLRKIAFANKRVLLMNKRLWLANKRVWSKPQI